MHNESALLLRLHEHSALSSPLLLINPPDGPGLYHALDIVGVLHDNYTYYVRWQSSDIPKWFDCHLPDDEFSNKTGITTVLFLPKGKQRLLAQLQLLGGRLSPGNRLIVIGAVDAGIKSAGKKIADYCDDVQKIDAARHCQAWSGVLKDLPLIKLEALFTSWSLEIENNALSISSLPGVFSDGRLDSGSRLLLDALLESRDELPENPAILDFGCGAGVLSTAIAKTIPAASITAVDNDAFALQATEKTFQDNSVSGKVLPTRRPDDLQSHYGLIISNPPFHQGVPQTTEITRQFISQLPSLFNPNGQAWIVANRFLNYEAECASNDLTVSRKAENRQYKILMVKR